METKTYKIQTGLKLIYGQHQNMQQDSVGSNWCGTEAALFPPM